MIESILSPGAESAKMFSDIAHGIVALLKTGNDLTGFQNNTSGGKALGVAEKIANALGASQPIE